MCYSVKNSKPTSIFAHNLSKITAVARVCDVPSMLAIIVGSGGKTITDGGKYPIANCFTGGLEQQFKHCPNPDGSVSFVSVKSG